MTDDDEDVVYLDPAQFYEQPRRARGDNTRETGKDQSLDDMAREYGLLPRRRYRELANEVSQQVHPARLVDESPSGVELARKEAELDHMEAELALEKRRLEFHPGKLRRHQFGRLVDATGAARPGLRRRAVPAGRRHPARRSHRRSTRARTAGSLDYATEAPALQRLRCREDRSPHLAVQHPVRPPRQSRVVGVGHPEGNAKRAKLAARMPAVRALRPQNPGRTAPGPR